MTTAFATGISQGMDAYSAAQEATNQAKARLKGKSVDLALVYCSSNYDYQKVVHGVRAATDRAPLIGCSTSGEFTEDKVLNNSIAVGLYSSDESKVYLSLAKGLREQPFETVQKAVSALPKKVDGFSHMWAILLHDGLAGRGEEAVLSAATELGSDIKFVGGSAGDDLKFKTTSVFVNDQVEKDAVGFCLVGYKKPI